MSSPAPGQARPNPVPAGAAPPQGQAPPAGAQRPPGAPAPAPGAPQQPAAGAPPAQAGGDINALKTRLRTEHPTVFLSDADFLFSKAIINATQGFRFRLDRNKTEVKTRFIPIAKKGGLLHPGFAHSASDVKSPEYSLVNTFTNQPVLRLKPLAQPGTTEVHNGELATNSLIGHVKVTQNGDTRTVVFSSQQPVNELVSLTFFCPLQKGGCCSSPAPAKLNPLRLALGKIPKVTAEENPNGDPCNNDLEINFTYPEGIEVHYLMGLAAALQVAARELI